MSASPASAHNGFDDSSSPINPYTSLPIITWTIPCFLMSGDLGNDMHRQPRLLRVAGAALKLQDLGEVANQHEIPRKLFWSVMPISPLMLASFSTNIKDEVVISPCCVAFYPGMQFMNPMILGRSSFALLISL